MQSLEEPTEGAPLTDNQPLVPDAIRVPRYALYLTMAGIIVAVAAYAIVGHLIDELVRDFADWAFGLKAEEKNILDENLEECGLGTLENALEQKEGKFSPAEECQDWHSSRILPGLEVCTALPWTARHASISTHNSADERSG